MQLLKIFLNRQYQKMPLILFDVCSIPVAWYLAYSLRFNLSFYPPNIFLSESLHALALLIPIQLLAYSFFKVYRGFWRFSSLQDTVRILKSVFVAIFFFIPVLYFLSLLPNIPRSVFPLYALLLIALLCGGRLLMRLFHERFRTVYETSKQRVLIVGAGLGGESLVRDLKRTSNYLPVGFIDDALLKQGHEIHGIRVLGPTGSLPKIVTRYNVDLIFIAIPSLKVSEMRRIVEICETTNVPFRTLPGLPALASGLVQVNALREVKIEDLLGREEILAEWSRIGKGIHSKVVIVTGGAGSIGSELCRQVLACEPKKLVILDHSEYHLYLALQEFLKKFPDIDIEPLLVSVTDEIAISYHFKRLKPDFVFHAAAFKHVPMLEKQIRSAVQNNIVGTEIVAKAAIDAKASKFVLISTDKAVNPTNVMGASKRIAEMFCQNLNERCDTKFITVRFGNVLGSAGSVLPLFQKQLQEGGPLTVTHPDIERYFMTIPEASRLILLAMTNGEGGEIFVLDMGEPIKIAYLAEQMIRLAGKIPGKDIEIKYTGLRPGEKLFEELFYESEMLERTENQKLFQAKIKKIDWDDLNTSMRLLKKASITHHNKELLILIKSLVPEFRFDEYLVGEDVDKTMTVSS